MVYERDYQRTRMYREEWEIIEDFDTLTLHQCWTFLAKSITKAQFVKEFPKTFAYLGADRWENPNSPDEYRPKQRLLYLHAGDRRSGLKLRPGYRRRYAEACYATITLPCWSRNKLTLLHELAHICCWKEVDGGDKLSAHGKEFAGVYLQLVRIVLGKKTADTLAESMAQHKVKVLVW